MNTIVSLLTAITKAVFEFLHLGYGMTRPAPRDPALKAEFDGDQKTLSLFHEGFCIDGVRSLSLKDSFRHAVIVGKSGIGKSTSTFIPSLLTMHTSGSSLVVHDPSKELFAVSSGHLRNQGYAVRVLDFGDPLRSVGFNPLEKIRHPSDVDRLSGMLVRTAMKQSDPFWDNSAEQLIKTAIRIALALPGQFANPGNALRIIKLMGAKPKRVDEIVARYADDSLYIEYKAFLANDAKVQSGVIATCVAALSIFSDEKVALVTSKDTLDFSSLRKRKTALFIQNRIADQQYFNVLISVWFEMFFASVLESVPKPEEKGIYILLDEAASGLRMPSLSNAMSHFRKFRVGCALGLQSIEQLRETYNDNDATTIIANCFLQMYFSEQSHATSKMLEEMLGRYSYEDKDGSGIRNLMEADEIRMLGKDRAIIIAGGEKPILAELRPFYERLWLNMRANLNPPRLIGVGVGNSITYIE